MTPKKNMKITISLSRSDLERISNVLGITDYDDIHEFIVKACGNMLDVKEGLTGAERMEAITE